VTAPEGYLAGLESSARERLSDAVYQYFRQGAGDEVSAAEAAQAWQRYRFRPHVLRDVSSVTTRTTLLGTPVRSPVAVAPTSLQRHAHPLGEAETARGVAAAGALLCVSSNAGVPFTEIASAGGPELSWWVQAYVLEDRDLTLAMLERAVSAGCAAVVLTVDTPVVAAKPRSDVSVWDVTPADFLHANEDLGGTRHLDVGKARDLVPSHIGWLAQITGLPVVVKGVLRPDDALVSVEAGAAAVWVSNHGGRQLDRSVATADALPAVAGAVGDTAEVYVDGGLRSGRDVLAALALGARAVFVGRPALWALSTGGAAGVESLLATLTGELEEAMTLSGCRAVDDVAGDLLAGPFPQAPTGRPSMA
jgi:4-hydroxymandelate oxidase